MSPAPRKAARASGRLASAGTKRGASNARLFEVLAIVCDALEQADIWYSLGFGTLLGAVRDGDLIPWDHDFDLFARPVDRDRIVEVGGELTAETGISIKYAYLPTADLALTPPGLHHFNASALVVFDGKKPIGDIYTYTLFEDGILRQYDLAQEIYWCPRNSFPAYFFEDAEVVHLRRKELPAPRAPELWLSHVYGADWRTPYRCVQRGGEPKPGTTSLGDRQVPDLPGLVRSCIAGGWDPTRYAKISLPRWPRLPRGAGPARTRGEPSGYEWETLPDLARW